MFKSFFKLPFLKQFIFSVLAIISIYCICFFLLMPVQPTTLDCGKVVSKSNDEVVIKHRGNTKLYLNIKFDKSGFQSLDCTPTTYFKNSVGDRVCFDLPNKVSCLYTASSLIGFILICILGFFLVTSFLTYLFGDII